jgi:hypothetical protein
MISRPTGRVRLNTIEAEVAQPEFIDKNIDSPNRIVVADIIVAAGPRCYPGEPSP